MRVSLIKYGIVSLFFLSLSAEVLALSIQPLKAIETYLNQLKTMKATFRQTNFDGTKTSGVFYLWRPGLMRLEYHPPSQELIIADGTYITHMRKDLDEMTSVAIDSTPAAILLGDSIGFGTDVKVVALEKDKGQWQLTLSRDDDADGAELTLIFNADPILLTEWIMKDPEGRMTHVRLDAIQSGVRLPKTLFKLET